LPTVYQTFGNGGPGGADSTDAPVSTTRRRQRRKSVSHTYVPAWARNDKIKLSILMPVFNEEATVIQAIESILTASYPCDIELIVVNDGSTDRTAHMLSQIESDRLVVREHPINQGKGAALLLAASEASGTHLLPFDADLEYFPEDIPKMLEPVMRGRCEVVYGARVLGYNTMYHSHWYAVGNRVLTCLANILFNAHISDLHTCLKLIPSSVLRQLRLKEMRFGLDTEITALLLKHGARPFEVPIGYISRSHAQGKKITWLDALACIRILLRVRVSRKKSGFNSEPWHLVYRENVERDQYQQFIEDDDLASVEPNEANNHSWDRASDQLFIPTLAHEGQVRDA